MLQCVGNLPKNKTPGNYGLTIEFYPVIWLLVDSLSYAFEFGELSNLQKQAIITLIEKKEKDKSMIKNWRPISLINADAKITSTTIIYFHHSKSKLRNFNFLLIA